MSTETIRLVMLNNARRKVDSAINNLRFVLKRRRQIWKKFLKAKQEMNNLVKHGLREGNPTYDKISTEVFLWKVTASDHHNHVIEAVEILRRAKSLLKLHEQRMG